MWTDNADNQGKNLGYENTDTKNSWSSVWCTLEKLGRQRSNLELLTNIKIQIAETYIISLECE